MRERGRGHEFMDLADDPAGDTEHEVPTASDLGAGALGFSGVQRKTDAPATGWTTLRENEFGTGPSAPMLPSSWVPDPKD